MAIYRFKVSFEDYDDVIREIDIKSNQTFENLHQAIHKSTGYNPEASSSFFVSNDQWIKGAEIAYIPTQRKIDRGVALMANSKLSSYIDDPHQKFYYTYNFDSPFDFHIELINILLNDGSGKEYPCVFRSVGEVPKPRGTGLNMAVQTPTSEEFDFLNEMDFMPEDTEELEALDGAGINTEEEEHNEDEVEEESNEFMDEFSDNEGYDADDLQKEDY